MKATERRKPTWGDGEGTPTGPVHSLAQCQFKRNKGKRERGGRGLRDALLISPSSSLAIHPMPDSATPLPCEGPGEPTEPALRAPAHGGGVVGYSAAHPRAGALYCMLCAGSWPSVSLEPAGLASRVVHPTGDPGVP